MEETIEFLRWHFEESYNELFWNKKIEEYLKFRKNPFWCESAEICNFHNCKFGHCDSWPCEFNKREKE